MSSAVAILGLAVVVLVHEAGHFFVARAVGMTPRKFYLGFGPPLVKRVRNGVEYGIAAFPLGGYVKIPGMHRPAAGDLRQTLPPLAGQFLSLIKDSSLLSIIGIGEFTLNAREVNSVTYSAFESYFPLAVGYLILTLPISLWTRYLEKKHKYET